jgi:hypothetical protein
MSEPGARHHQMRRIVMPDRRNKPPGYEFGLQVNRSTFARRCHFLGETLPGGNCAHCQIAHAGHPGNDGRAASLGSNHANDSVGIPMLH